MYEIQGKIEMIDDTQQVTDRFKKREFVIEVQDGMYSELIKLQCVQDRTALLDGYKEGDTIKVSFGLKGRKYEKAGERMYFTNLDAWRIQKVEVFEPEPEPPASDAQSDLDNSPDSDDLPF